MECTPKIFPGTENSAHLGLRTSEQTLESYSTENILTFAGSPLEQASLTSESIQKVTELFEKNKQNIFIYFTRNKIDQKLIRQQNGVLPRMAKISKVDMCIECPSEISETLKIIEGSLFQSLVEQDKNIRINLDSFKLDEFAQIKSKYCHLLKKKCKLIYSHTRTQSQLHLDLIIKDMPFYRFTSNFFVFINKIEPLAFCKKSELLIISEAKKRKLDPCNDFNKDFSSTEDLLIFDGASLIPESTRTVPIQKLIETFEKNKANITVYFERDGSERLIRPDKRTGDLRMGKLGPIKLFIKCPLEVSEVMTKTQSSLFQLFELNSVPISTLIADWPANTFLQSNLKSHYLLEKQVDLNPLLTQKHSKLNLVFFIEDRATKNLIPIYGFLSRSVIFANRLYNNFSKTSNISKHSSENEIGKRPTLSSIPPFPSFSKEEERAENKSPPASSPDIQEFQVRETNLSPQSVDPQNEAIDPFGPFQHFLESNDLQSLDFVLSEDEIETDIIPTSTLQSPIFNEEERVENQSSTLANIPELRNIEANLPPTFFPQPVSPQGGPNEANFLRFHHYLEQSNDSQSLEFLLTIFEKNIPIDLLLFMHYSDPLTQKKMHEMILAKLNNLKEVDNFYGNPGNIPS